MVRPRCYCRRCLEERIATPLHAARTAVRFSPMTPTAGVGKLMNRDRSECATCRHRCMAEVTTGCVRVHVLHSPVLPLSPRPPSLLSSHHRPRRRPSSHIVLVYRETLHQTAHAHDASMGTRLLLLRCCFCPVCVPPTAAFSCSGLVAVASAARRRRCRRRFLRRRRRRPRRRHGRDWYSEA